MKSEQFSIEGSILTFRGKFEKKLVEEYKSSYLCSYKIKELMFEFDQYLGFLAFLTILTMGFWLMIFLMAILPYWIGGSIAETLKEKKEKKRREKEAKKLQSSQN